MPDRTIALSRSGFEDTTGFDTGVSHALLERVSAGELPETLRIYRPSRVVAFGKHDRLVAGFRAAVDVVRDHGYAPIVRLPGGRAAVFHEETVAFSWTIPTLDPIRNIRERFHAATGVLVRALGRVGVSSAVGEIPGEYCPGEFSIHHDGRIKLAGIGQRLGRSAAHVGGVLVVGNGDAVRDVLVPTYDALEIDWRPSSVGAADDVVPGLTLENVIDAVIRVVENDATVVPTELDEVTLDRAATLASLHLP
ncbi:MAG: lipoate--protein ligase family protein [Acidimicrobiia bacterium]